MVIAIDGPAGAGKSTVAKRLAKELGLSFLDTGAMYRCIALKASRLGVSPDDAVAAEQVADSTLIGFGPGDPQRVFLDGEDVTDAIRQPEIGDMASAISVHPGVRRILVRQQQQIVAEGNITLEGRDATTVIAPDAPVKVYMTASVDCRAQRRYKELAEKGMAVNLEELKAQIEERDARDTNRTESPLRVAEGATVLDTDEMTIDEVVSAVRSIAHSP